MNLSFSNLCTQAFYQVKISPNSQYVANVTGNKVVVRRLEADLSIVNVFESSKVINYIHWSPNSECILLVNFEMSKIQVHSVIDPKWTATIKDSAFPIASVKWTPDSKSLMCTSEMGLRVSVWNLSKRDQKFINYSKFQDRGIEASPDGKYIAVAHKRLGKDTLSVYYSASFVLLQQFELNTVDLENFKWSPDSSCIAVWDSCLYNSLIIYRPDGYICATYCGYEYGLGIKTVNWSQNEKLVAVGYHNQTVHLLSTISWDLISILEHSSVVKNQDSNTLILEETTLLKAQQPNNKTRTSYQSITKRSFSLPIDRLDFSQPNPKVGVGICQFSSDSLYLASRNGKVYLCRQEQNKKISDNFFLADNMPTVLWIWSLTTLTCTHIIIFQNTIKQIMWNPCHGGALAVHCGDRNIHFIKTKRGELSISPSQVDTSKCTTESKKIINLTIHFRRFYNKEGKVESWRE
ncbi:hypothetical protein BY458DRAFT_467448 [Sporodiniella umbellata]|nr:hypothetical protein BY458DRAFT_467448 [Sporodiniella umbellata]